MNEVRWGWVVGGTAGAVGIGAGFWIGVDPPGSALGARVLLGALALGFGVWMFSGKSRGGQIRVLCSNVGMLAAMGAGVWTYNIENGLAAGLLRLRKSAWYAFGSGWETVCLGVLPAVGCFIALALVAETLRGVTKRWREKKGRKQSESELYGKAKFLAGKHMDSLAKESGILLGEGPRGIVCYGLEGSAMSFAPPRTGKGATIALNYLDADERGWSGSTVLIDPRGETFPVVARRRRDMGRRPLLLDPFGVVAKHRELEGDAVHLPVWESELYNPLDFIRDGPEAVRDIGVLAEALLERPKSDGGNATHFYESARALISGYLAWVRFKMPRERRNLKTLFDLLSLGEEAREELFAVVAATPKFCGGLMHHAMERSRRVGKEEGGSNFTTVSNQLSFLNYPEIAEHTRKSTFDPLDLAHGDLDVFVVVPDDMIDMVKGWLRLWVTIPYAVSGRRAMQRDMLVMVDEMPRLGYLKPIMDGYNLAAGKGVHFWCFAQSVSAMDATWGADARKTLMHLAELVQVLGWPRMDVEGAEMLSKAIGAATFESRSESRSGQIRDSSLLPDGQTSLQESLSVVKEQLVPADDILSMGPNEQFVVAAPKDVPRDVIYLKHARYWQLRKVRALADPNPYVIRKVRAALPEAA